MTADDRSWLTADYPELRDGPPWVMHDMVLAERELPAGIVDLPGVRALADAVRAAVEAGQPVVVTGCGTSEHGAQAVTLLLDEALTAAGLAAPGRVESRQAFEAALAPRHGGICIAISHGGTSTATNDALRAAAQAGARTALITAEPGQEAGGLATDVLVTPLADRSWCHTVGYVSPILAGAAIGAALRGERLDAGALRAQLTAADEAAEAAAGDVAKALSPCAHLLVVGSGADVIAARELTLKIEEGAWIPTAMRELETIQHGHFPATDGRTGLVALLCEHSSPERRVERTAQCFAAANRIGLVCAAIVSEAANAELPEDGTAAGRIVVPVDPALGTLGVLLASAVALQRLTLALAGERNANPDLLRRQEAAYREARAVSSTKVPRVATG